MSPASQNMMSDLVECYDTGCIEGTYSTELVVSTQGGEPAKKGSELGRASWRKCHLSGRTNSREK